MPSTYHIFAINVKCKIIISTRDLRVSMIFLVPVRTHVLRISRACVRVCMGVWFKFVDSFYDVSLSLLAYKIVKIPYKVFLISSKLLRHVPLFAWFKERSHDYIKSVIPQIEFQGRYNFFMSKNLDLGYG